MGVSSSVAPGEDLLREDEDDRTTKKSKMREVDQSPAPTGDVVTKELPPSYKDKLIAATIPENQSWPEEEEEVPCGPGDIIINKKGDIPSLELSMEFEKRLAKRWERAVIVKLMGRNISYRVITEKLNAIWQPKGMLKVIDLDNNLFIVKFSNDKDYLHSLVDGPWTLFRSLLCVMPWNLNFCAATNSIDRAVVWVHFPEIPLHNYHPNTLHTLGDMVGESVKIDHATREY
ncbi:hypothetical protein Tsubulata_012160 [Turnera subulata]|uniref:DUF4283 domain-containing protein n=1 Tax=Turnera subulata TaxID=218843 RepID=A0A9Q0JM81_9ROSI|nr:hypothetical protein Tsubulata_012160 [Turnera subulata]